LLGLGVVLFAVGAKLALVDRYGTDQPYADQWAAEGMYLLRGPLYYQVDLSQITATHGEHRPGLTRLWVLGLIRANGGQWDPLVELVANLLIYAAFLAVAWRLAASLAGGIRLAGIAFGMAVLFALPCAYENFLWGFQSQFLFLLLLGLGHVQGTLAEPKLGWRWGLAQVAGLLGLFSIAAGAMSAAALVLASGVALIRGQRDRWAWTTLAVNLVLLTVGLLLLPEAVVPAGTRIARLGQAVPGLGYLLSWPLAGYGWCGLVQAPWLVLTGALLKKRFCDTSVADRTIVILGWWVAGMAFAIAYGRVVTSENIGVRYYDVLVVGLWVNLLALVRLGSAAVRGRLGWAGAGLIWLAVVAAGLGSHNQPADLASLFKFQRDQALQQREIVRDFIRNGDPARLQEFADATHRFPHFQITLDFLRDPKVPLLLPPSLVPDGRAGPWSRRAAPIAAQWPLVLGAGGALLVVGTRLVRPRRSSVAHPLPGAS
jgi:hypothetical protein